MKTIKSVFPFVSMSKAFAFAVVIICMAFYGQVTTASSNDPKDITPIFASPNPPNEIVLTLIPHVYPNGFNISCSGLSDGSINLSVTGGSGPYTYLWSTKDTTPNISNLSADYYRVRVRDQNGVIAEGEIQLTQPSPDMIPEINTIAYEYSNGYNVSCYGCYNGSIDLIVTGGSGLYGYNWRDGATTQDRYGLGAGDYQVVIRGISECNNRQEFVRNITISEPPSPYSQSQDWTMYGNANSDPSTQFIGTTDNIGMAFKTYNSIRMFINANGNVGIGITGASEKFAVIGKGRFSSDLNVGGNLGVGVASPTEKLEISGNGKISGNFNVDGNIGIGTPTPTEKLEITGNGKVSGNFNVNGNVGIGTTTPTAKLEVAGNGKITANLNVGGNVGIGTDSIPANYMVAVGGKMICTEINVQLVNDWEWPDFVFEDSYKRMTLSELERYINTHKHLPNTPSADEVKSNGVNVGETNSMLLQKIEELTLYIIDQNKNIIEQNKKIEYLQKEIDTIKKK